MIKFIIPLLFLTSSLLFSQNKSFNSKDLSVSTEDLTISKYLPDTTAHSLYIYEKGFTMMDKDEDYSLVTTYEAKIKILDKDGVESANISIPLSKATNSSRKEKIKDLEAFTYKLVNGKVLKKTLNTGQVYEEDYENYMLKKFTFPDVEPGDVLVYSYKLISPFIFDFTTWEFQEDIPKIHSEFIARIPGNYEYYTTLVGNLKLKSNDFKVIEDCISFSIRAEPAACGETTYIMEDIPAFKEEDYMTSARNFKSKVEFELKQTTELSGYVKKYTRTWDDVDDELKSSKGMGRQWRRDGLVEDLLPAGIKSMSNNIEKAKAIYRFVQKNYNWNEHYNIFKDINLKDIIKDHTGNVMAINTLLHNLYDAEGFKVFPVMASTRQKGFPTKVHPVLSDFNYFFIKLELDGKEYFLDATGKNLDFAQLPFRALNSYARLIDFENGSSWVDIKPEKYSTITFRDSIHINPDGTSEGFSEQILTGYHALRFRDHIGEYSDFQVFNLISKPNSETASEEMHYTNVDSLDRPLEIRYDLKNKSQKINDKIFFNPFSFKFFNDNPFTLEERNYPIDFGYKDVYMYSAIIEIPEGYKISELPETKALRMPDNAGSLVFSVNKTGERTINVQCRLSFPFAHYHSAYYDGLKQFFDQIISVQNQSLIVLEENG